MLEADKLEKTMKQDRTAYLNKCTEIDKLTTRFKGLYSLTNNPGTSQLALDYTEFLRPF
jgi:hypothetical protein